MVETRSQTVSTDEVIAVRMTALENTVAEHGRQMTKSIAEMFEAVKLITSGKALMYQSSLMSTLSKENQAESSDPNKEVRSGSQGYYGGVTRLGKIDFPRFNGDKIQEWLFKVEEFFGVDFTPDDMYVKTAAIHYDGHAATWYHSFIQSGVGLEVLYDWASYVVLLKETITKI
ncbi:hypothetical protein V5N11_026428 [Cardamine amara subsp. amara]|uniref:Retrotransposon gag domain-containing protein n=1 Tax=Cardamine amara subsp. amara TaxID=228776 RepID=A0ABD1B2G8_CARAN